ncbi:MAG: hypothetical protein ACREUU_03145, partial [Gammaproteobacteria bacterium]
MKISSAILITASFILVAVLYFVAPMGPRWTSALLGTALFWPDAVLNAAILEWGYRSLWSPTLAVFDWPANFPLTNGLANTEHLLGWQVLYSPLRWAGVGGTAAYNLLLLTSFVVSGLGTALLATRLGANTAGAWLAGFLFAFVPFHVNHMVHLQTMSIAWSPFAVLFLDRFLARPRAADAAGLAVSFILSALSGMYFAVLLPIILITYVALAYACRRYRFAWRAVGGLVATSLLSVLALAPIILPYVRFARANGLEHSRATLATFSVTLSDLVRIPDWVRVWSGTPLADSANFAAAFPGLVTLLLVGCGIVLSSGPRESRNHRTLLGALCLAAALLALGPVLQVDQGRRVRIAGTSVPMPGIVFTPISAIRVPMRIMLYTYLFGTVLGGLGATALADKVPAPTRRMLIPALLIAAAVEVWPQPWVAARSIELPPPLALSDAYPFLAAEGDRGAAVELPGADGNGYRTPVMARYTYGSAGHLRRIVAYNGSVRLPAVDRLQDAAGRLPDERARATLVAAGVT